VEHFPHLLDRGIDLTGDREFRQWVSFRRRSANARRADPIPENCVACVVNVRVALHRRPCLVRVRDASCPGWVGSGDVRDPGLARRGRRTVRT
jgi:hypothetical protein